ncbi:MAG: SRPBCC family protein [Acidimicrobiales bacterium]
MDLTADLVTDAAASTLFAWIDDLANYPQWLDIVTKAVQADAAPGDPGPAWTVDLRGRLGPLARTKRLRMVRSVHETDAAVTFDRRELDGRHHSPWVLRATIEEAGTQRALHMALHYGGGLFGSVIERVLREEIRRSRDRLGTLAAAGPPPAPSN